jgi:hypothetical protein
MDVAALVVAIFAALVAAGSLGWQYYVWWHSRRLNVAVGLDEVEVHDEPDEPEVSTTVFKVTVVNRGAFTVKVVGATLIPTARPVRSWITGATIGLPREVKSNDGEEIHLPVGFFVGELPSDDPIEAWIQLSTGEEFRSAPTSVLTRFGGPDIHPLSDSPRSRWSRFRAKLRRLPRR